MVIKKCDILWISRIPAVVTFRKVTRMCTLHNFSRLLIITWLWFNKCCINYTDCVSWNNIRKWSKTKMLWKIDCFKTVFKHSCEDSEYIRLYSNPAEAQISSFTVKLSCEDSEYIRLYSNPAEAQISSFTA